MTAQGRALIVILPFLRRTQLYVFATTTLLHILLPLSYPIEVYTEAWTPRS
jgi:hypothetical protein